MPKDVRRRIRDAVHPIARQHRLQWQASRSPSAPPDQLLSATLTPLAAEPGTIDEAHTIVMEVVRAIQGELVDDGKWVDLCALFPGLGYPASMLVAESPRSYLRTVPHYAASRGENDHAMSVLDIVTIGCNALVRTEDDNRLTSLVWTMNNAADTLDTPQSVVAMADQIAEWWDAATSEDRQLASRLAEPENNTFDEIVDMVADLNADPA